MIGFSRKILWIDDDPNLLEALARRLRRKFELRTATSGQEGLDLLCQEGPFAVVVSDYKMPEMNGVEFLKRVRELSPDSVTVMLTGLAEMAVVVAALNEGHIWRFLQKPCPSEFIESTLEDCLERYRLEMAERALTEELNARNQELRVLNEELELRVGTRTATIRRLYRFVTELNGNDSLEGVAQMIVSTAAEVLQSRRVSVMLPDRQREYLQVVAGVGLPGEVKERGRVPVGSGIAGRVFAFSQSIVANESGELAEQDDRYDGDFFASVPLASALLVTPSGPVGVLNITERSAEGPYTAEDLANLRAISEAGAIALCSQIRLRERNEARDGIMLGLAKLAECRDPETGEHLERVQVFCRMISETLMRQPKFAPTVTKAFIENIVRSSPLHDVGKVGIPDVILLKPGRLTPDEFEIMKQHAMIGGDTIRSVMERCGHQDFLQMGMDIAYYHHEKYNGKGYPKGLASDAIPLAARIMALADVYDALTSKRVYKQAMPHEKAAAIIYEDSGKHFDPDVVEAFRTREEEFRQTAERLREKPDTEATEQTEDTIRLAKGNIMRMCAALATAPASSPA